MSDYSTWDEQEQDYTRPVSEDEARRLAIDGRCTMLRTAAARQGHACICGAALLDHAESGA